MCSLLSVKYSHSPHGLSPNVLVVSVLAGACMPVLRCCCVFFAVVALVQILKRDATMVRLCI